MGQILGCEFSFPPPPPPPLPPPPSPPPHLSLSSPPPPPPNTKSISSHLQEIRQVKAMSENDFIRKLEERLMHVCMLSYDGVVRHFS